MGKIGGFFHEKNEKINEKMEEIFSCSWRVIIIDVKGIRHKPFSTPSCCKLACLSLSDTPTSVIFAGKAWSLQWVNPGNTKGEVSLYSWPPVWLVWNQLYDNWQFLFLFAKQTTPNQSNRRSMVQWYFPL